MSWQGASGGKFSTVMNAYGAWGQGVPDAATVGEAMVSQKQIPAET